VYTDVGGELADADPQVLADAAAVTGATQSTGSGEGSKVGLHTVK
jgi:hypothetical protein